MHDFLVSAGAFIVLIGIMVVVHEFGHFAVAKLCKVRVEAFSIGFGPRLIGFKYGETDYKICLLPFGGYVKMTGENPSEEQPANDAAAFSSHPRWQRMLIGLAGPAANFVLAFVLMFAYFAWINEIPDIKTATLEWVTPGSAADRAGMHPGDVIRQFGAASNPDLETIVDSARDAANAIVPVTLDRNGQLVPASLHVQDKSSRNGLELSQTGMFLQYETAPIRVDETVAGWPAERAGLRAGDDILAVDGHAFHTLDPFVDYLQSGKGNPITLTVARNGVTLPPMVVRPSDHDSQWQIGFRAVPPADPPVAHRPLPFATAVAESREYCAGSSMMIVDVLQKLLTRKASVKQLAGPVGIAHAAGQAAETKYWVPKFELAAGISLNLGILNLMPFPILDGGLILLLLIESVMRHDISMVVKERLYQAAFVVLVMFFVYVSFNDVAKLSMFSHLKP